VIAASLADLADLAEAKKKVRLASAWTSRPRLPILKWISDKVAGATHRNSTRPRFPLVKWVGDKVVDAGHRLQQVGKSSRT